MFRAPLLPASVFGEVFSSGDTEGRLLEHGAEPVFREALWLTDPPLARELEELLLEPGAVPPARRAKVLQRVARFLIRASTQTALGGPFTVVGAASAVGQAVTPRGPGATKHTRVALGPVMSLVRRAERDPALRPELAVYANPAAYRWGGRVHLPYPVPGTEGGRGERVAMVERGTVRRALSLARTPIRYAELLERLAGATPEETDACLAALLSCELLLSTLRPPPTETDPLAYLLRQLPAAADAPLLREARELRRLVAEYDRRPLGTGLAPLRTLVERTAVTETDPRPPLRVDTLGSGPGIRLPGETLGELVRVIGTLQRVFARERALAPYAREFRKRYGSREIPILELLDPELGLGPPPGYGCPPPTRRWRAPGATAANPGLDAYLAELLGRSQRRGASEIVLDEGELLELALPEPEPAPLELDLHVLVLGSTAEAVAHGDLTLLLLDDGTAPPGQALRRYAHLDPAFEESLSAIALEEQGKGGETIFADLTWLDERGLPGSGVAQARVHPYQVAVGTTPGVPFERHIPLEDLTAGVVGERFYLRSQQLARQVEVRAAPLQNAHTAPNIVRFLFELATQDASAPAWRWGALAALPHLPRVRLGRVILAPASWSLPRELLEGEAGSDWDARVAAWRAEWGVPRHVCLGRLSDRLLLDLDNAWCREILRQEATAGARVTEAPWGAGAWAADGRGRPHVTELVVPVRSPAPAPPWVAPPPVPSLSPAAGRSLVPGDGCLDYRLYGPVSDRTELLGELTRLVAGADPALRWFFERRAHPDPHLRFRVLGGPAGLARVWPVLAERFADLLARGAVTRIAIETYERELERFGGLDGMRACEAIFCLDSALVLELLELAPRSGVPMETLACLSVDGFLTGLGLPPEARTSLIAGLSAADGLPRRAASEARQHPAEHGWIGQEGRRLLQAVLPGRAAGSGEQALVEVHAAYGRLAGPAGELLALPHLDAVTPAERETVLAGIHERLVRLHTNRLGLTPHRARLVFRALVEYYAG